MKVAMLDPSLFTPPYDSAICIGLQEQDADLTLYTRRVRPTDFPLRSAVNAVPVFYGVSEAMWRRKIPGRLVAKVIEHLFDMWSLCRRLEQDPPDIIHAQWFPLPAADIRFVQRLRRIAPVVLTVHDTQIFHGQASSRFQAAGWRDLLEAVDHLVVHLDTTRRTLIGWGIQPDKISVIEHGIFSWSEKAEGVDRVDDSSTPGLREDAADDVLDVLFFGRIGEYKGLDLLVDALDKLDDHARSRMRLLIVGPPAFDVSALINKARSLLGENLFVRTEFVPEGHLQEYLRTANIIVFPYREIDSSGALMTAMAHSSVILASDLDTFKDVLEPTNCAEFFETGNAASLAEKLGGLIASPDRRSELVSRLETARGSDLSWPVIAGKTLAMYESILRDR